MLKQTKIPMVTFLLGMGLWVLAIVLVNTGDPKDAFLNIPVTTLIICPLLGIIGIIFSVLRKKYGWILPNLLLLFAFFITMDIGYYFLGP